MREPVNRAGAAIPGLCPSRTYGSPSRLPAQRNRCPMQIEETNRFHLVSLPIHGQGLSTHRGWRFSRHHMKPRLPKSGDC